MKTNKTLITTLSTLVMCVGVLMTSSTNAHSNYKYKKYAYGHKHHDSYISYGLISKYKYKHRYRNRSYKKQNRSFLSNSKSRRR